VREHDLIRSDDAERLGLGYGPDFLVLSQLWVDGIDVQALRKKTQTALI
jgi:hypothetical protein